MGLVGPLFEEAPDSTSDPHLKTRPPQLVPSLSFWALPSLRPAPSASQKVVRSWLGQLTNKVCLEVFSGTGILSLGLLTSGILGVLLIEKRTRLLSSSVSQSVSNQKNVRMMRGDAFWVCYEAKANCDILLSDPPFLFEDATFNSTKLFLGQSRLQSKFIIKTNLTNSFIGFLAHFLGFQLLTARFQSAFCLYYLSVEK